MKRIFFRIWPYMKNKYVLTISLFFIWIMFFDQNNMVDRIRIFSEIRQLEEDKHYYQEQIRQDSARLHELTTDRDNLEKYAREQYLMKNKDEDVFIVIEDKE